MKLYNKYFASNYDELITYYPRYYREVLEMKAILQAHGRIADGMEDNIEQVYNNCFIDYADEDTIARLEAFLNIGLNKARTLDERRRLVKSYFVGFGKVSASMLAEMIASYTGAAVNIYFEPFDEEGNNRLYIEFERGEEATLYMSDINLLLSKKIPAHIEYRAALTYRYGIGIGKKRTKYTYDYTLSGTLPDIALIGDLQAAAAVVASSRKNYASDYQTAAEDALTGLQPSTATLGAINTINAGTEATATNIGADYIYCAEDIYAQS